jgi:hypothetical protein
MGSFGQTSLNKISSKCTVNIGNELLKIRTDGGYMCAIQGLLR